ncbi:MAG: hypothetical protein IKI69_03470 [Oscillospiraceae bacterium]|nr:hypothetical protein [Oscillospiraceae bacterium]
MKRNAQVRTIAFALLLALCAGLLSGCGSGSAQPAAETAAPSSFTVEEPTPTTEPTASPAPVVDYDALDYTTEKVVFKDKHNEYAAYSLSRSMETCTLGNRSYSFEKSISEGDRAARIRETEELFQRLGIDPELRICLYTTLKDTYIEDSSVYGRFGTLAGADYTAAVLLGIYGEFCNYGMATGYARLLAGETPEAPGELPADWAYYDLNYLCFQPKFSGEEDAALCEKLALAFAADYVEKHGDAAYLELLRRSGEPEEAEAARAALLDFYAAQGVKPSLSPILYAMGGANYEYRAKCEHAVFFMDQGWSDYFSVKQGLRPDSFLHEDYGQVRTFFETMREEMGKYRDYFSQYALPDDISATRIYFLKKGADSSFDGFSRGLGVIYINSLHAIMHEYTHVLTGNALVDASPKWQREGLATYYQVMFASFARESENFAMHYTRAEGDSFAVQLEQELGRPFQAETDWLYMCNMWTYYYDTYAFMDFRAESYNAYMAAVSFLDYLIREFGEQHVLDYLLDNHDLTTLTDMTFDELRFAWQEDVEARFALLPKYNS